MVPLRADVAPAVVNPAAVNPATELVGSEAWTLAKSKRQMAKEKKQNNVNKKAINSEKQPARTNGPSGTGVVQDRRRPPKTAAVSIKIVSKGISYSDAIRKARNSVNLSELGIKESRGLYAVNGSALIEIPGTEGGKQADILRGKLAEVFGDQAVITRPVVKGDMRLSGFDDSIASAEIADVVAAADDCTSREMKVGQIRQLKNGLCTVWL